MQVDDDGVWKIGNERKCVKIRDVGIEIDLPVLHSFFFPLRNYSFVSYNIQSSIKVSAIAKKLSESEGKIGIKKFEACFGNWLNYEFTQEYSDGEKIETVIDGVQMFSMLWRMMIYSIKHGAEKIGKYFVFQRRID